MAFGSSLRGAVLVFVFFEIFLRFVRPFKISPCGLIISARRVSVSFASDSYGLCDLARDNPELGLADNYHAAAPMITALLIDAKIRSFNLLRSPTVYAALN